MITFVQINEVVVTDLIATILAKIEYTQVQTKEHLFSSVSR